MRTAAHGHQPSAERLGHDYHVRVDSEVMRRQEGTSAVHAGLDLIQDEQGAVAPAQRLRSLQIFAGRHQHAALGLDGFDDEGCETAARELARQLIEISERYGFGVRKQWTEALLPERIRH